MTAYDYFNKAAQCEIEAAEIYRHLADVFTSDRRAKAAFLRLADEEVQHAARIRLLSSRHVRGSKLFRGKPLPDVDGALRHLQEARLDVLAGHWGRDLKAVLQRARGLEDRLDRFHAESIARLIQPELAAFFSTLLLQDKQHRELLWLTESTRA